MTDLLILGASARAAAFSALRTGLRPWCADLFADADLRGRCAAMRLPGRYPQGFLSLLRQGPNAPWIYTGGLENHPELVGQLARLRPLWGNAEEELRRARNPFVLADAAARAGLPAPEVSFRASPPRPGRWLVKPLAGSGGSGIRFHDPALPPPARPSYLQEFISGSSAAALYVADGYHVRLLGLTRQLVGEPWLHASPFRYCGNVGPLPLPPHLHASLPRLGDALLSLTGLRGLFGIDGIVRDDAFWPVEVNPRYTASVEVWEYATGSSALALHASAFQQETRIHDTPAPPRSVVGKAVYYAPADILVPADGPWQSVLWAPASVEVMPAFADIPHPGERIATGHPVLTFFARGEDEQACEAALRNIAAQLDALCHAAA